MQSKVQNYFTPQFSSFNNDLEPCDGKRCDGEETCENKNGQCECKEGLLFDEEKEDCLGKFF